MAKRTFDIVVASLAILLLSPIMLAVVLALTLEARGPVLFWSTRVGRHGRVFRLARFRTMVAAAPDVTPEARLTSVGRFIRNLSLDDAPSLFHIVRGDLSIVGPRPMEPERVARDEPVWQCILSVRPGFLSYTILQLASRYNTSPAEEKQWLECDYVHRQSFAFDLRIIAAAITGYIASRGNVKARGKPAR